MFLTILVIAVIVARLRGGRVQRLAEVPWRHLELILAAFAIQLGLAGASHGGWIALAPLAPWLHLGSYGLLFAGIWANRWLRGMGLVGLGALANFIVIAANGGRMPVSAEGLAALGGTRTAAFLAGTGDHIHGLQTAATRLAFLGDVIHFPPQIPLPVLFSPGDVAIAAGLFAVVQGVMLSPYYHDINE